jgi:hypothetical protein
MRLANLHCTFAPCALSIFQIQFINSKCTANRGPISLDVFFIKTQLIVVQSLNITKPMFGITVGMSESW